MQHFHYFMQISKGAGRRFAIGDIHGCRQTLKRMLQEKLQITPSDQVVLLGDYIVRGPNTIGTLEYIMNLQEKGYQVYALRGNHEQNLLNAIAEGAHALELYTNYYELTGLQKHGKMRPDIFHFLNTLPFYIELDRFYLVHAGFNFNKNEPFKDYSSMLWIRDYEPDTNKLKGKHVIHGHQPHYLNTIKERIQKRSARIPLDNGIAHNNPHHSLDINQLQNLCALDIDRFKLYVQPNAENR